MEPLTLVVLAAGRSTRFGRPKQLEPVGPNGECLLEITMDQAFAAGVQEAVIVVASPHRAIFEQRLLGRSAVRTVVQEEALGTAHATASALHRDMGTIIVVNGDDHYGSGAIALAVEHAYHAPQSEHAMVAFELGRTLSTHGGVNRAICSTDANDLLLRTIEVRGLKARTNGEILDAEGATWDPSTLVSMNLWVLRPSIFPAFEHTSSTPTTGGEHGLPSVIQHAVGTGAALRVLRTSAPWSGLTFPEDADLVRRSLNGPA
jgi:NDP-sugar pyrophosphorylase family protein